MNPQQVVARLQVDPAGIIDAPAPADPHLVIHVGPSVEITCERGGQFHRGLRVHGDIDIIPPGMASRWILKNTDRGLIVRVPQGLMNEVAEESGVDPLKARVMNRFQVRDPRIEHLVWSLMDEIGRDRGGDRLYRESVGRALALTLLEGHSMASSKAHAGSSRGMSGLRLRRVLSFIEDRLDSDLSLAAIAMAAGLSVSHCQRAFRAAMGIPVHRYVIRQRVRRAASLLAESRLSVCEVALEVGFSHPSHLSHHMRRLLGNSPARLRAAADREA